MLVDGVAAIGRGGRRLDAGEVLGEVAQVERRLMLLQEGHHLPGDVALVEAVARGHDPGGAALALGGAFGLDHAREGAGQMGHGDGVAGLVRRAIGLVPEALVARPLREELALALDAVGGALAQREAVARVFDGPCRHRLEAHRAPRLEHGQGRMQRPRNHGGIEPGALERLAARQVPVHVHGLGRPALADNRRDFLLAHRIDEHQGFAAEAVEVLLDHAADEERGHARVERVAALVEDFERRGGDERMPRRHAAVRPGHERPQRRWRGGAARRRLRVRNPLLAGGRDGKSQDGGKRQSLRSAGLRHAAHSTPAGDRPRAPATSRPGRRGLCWCPHAHQRTRRAPPP